MQRQNTLGIAFAGLMKHVLERFGAPRASYDLEVKAQNIFRGITLPGRSATACIDLLATCANSPRAVLSTKWSLRHDRLNDMTEECPAYKSAYQRLYRATPGAPDLLYYVVTNEYDPSSLNKILRDPCVDAVVHVHKIALVDVCRLDNRLGRLLDLADLIRATSSW